jgi:hypothetical protein
LVLAAADPAADGVNGTALALDADIITSAALVAAALGGIAALATQADLLRTAAVVPADQAVLAACVTEARFANGAAFIGTRP